MATVWLTISVAALTWLLVLLQPKPSAAQRDWLFYVPVSIFLALNVAAVVDQMTLTRVVEPVLHKVSDWQTVELSLIQDRISLLLTMATLGLGGAGALFVYFHRERGGIELRAERFAFLALGWGVVSVICGYLTHGAVLWMVRERIFNLQNEYVAIPPRLQLVTTIAVFACLTASVVSTPRK